MEILLGRAPLSWGGVEEIGRSFRWRMRMLLQGRDLCYNFAAGCREGLRLAATVSDFMTGVADQMANVA